ncbi:MAG TPA: hypothetical protein VGJ48_08260 [Pyrinomonadaceae bacterium]|jgi:hypothetical protein
MTRNRFERLAIFALLCSFPTLLVAGNSGPAQAISPRAAIPLTYTLPLAGSHATISESADINRSRVIELIPAEYRKRYLKWRNDYLSTEVGRNQWDRYALDTNFTLTITVSKDRAEGAILDGYRWDATGRLIGASITLGTKLDSGYPSSINYPITCSLAPGNLPPEVKGTILAATKLAHEFGHLNRTMTMDGRLYQLQNSLMIEYNRIFETNGRNCQEPRLLELVRKMDGTPVSIAQDRESWAEVGAILYLQERLAGDRNIKMPDAIKQAIEGYYVTYPGRVDSGSN